jgi:YD repeat-containing protein
MDIDGRYKMKTREPVFLLCFTLALVMFFAAGKTLIAEEYEYDALGRLTRVIYDDGSRISYIYDRAGNITQIRMSTGAETEYLPLTLYQGFNLFSVPLDLLDPDLDVALAGIMASMDSILALRDGEWEVSAPLQGGGGWAIDQVKTLDAGETYVVYMKNPAVLELEGTPLIQTAVTLQQGFNLAPYNSTSQKTVEVAFAGIRDDVDTILKYDAAESKWKACVPNPAGGWFLKQFSVVEAGDGLVIYLKVASSVWDVGP